MNHPQQPPDPYNDPYSQQQQYYQQPGTPGYNLVPDPPKKKKKKGSKSSKGGKESGGAATANVGATVGIWVAGIGLPLLLIYFLITKVFMREEPMGKNPFPPVQLNAQQLKDAEIWGQQLARNLTEGRQDDVHKTVIYDALTYRTQVAFKADRNIRKPIAEEINRLFTTDVPGIFRQVFNTAERVPASMLRMGKRAGYPCATIRVMPKPDRVLYFDMLIIPAGNEFKIVDMYDWTLGSYASEVTRRAVLIEMSTDHDRLKPWETVFGAEAKTEVLKLKGLLQEDILNSTAAYDTINTLPAPVRQTPDVYAMEVKALLKQFDAGTIQPKIDRLTSLLENPPLRDGYEIITGVLLAEIYQKAGKVDEADAAIHKAAKIIGGDAMLHVINGQRKLAAGDIPGAQACANEAARENARLMELTSLRSQIEAKLAAPK